MSALTHPDAPDARIEPKAEHVDAYLSQGWVEDAEKGDSKPPKKSAE